MLKTMFFCLVLISMILLIFFLASKNENWIFSVASSFECGFSSYFFSRFSFSIHYFMVGMIFLFLDLEICLMLPFLNGSFDVIKMHNLMFLFIGALIVSLFYEWVEGNLEWKF